MPTLAIGKMDLEDFADNQKYKVILPTIYIINWILMVTGPILYPIAYQIYTLIFFTYITIKSILNLVWCTIGLINGLKSIKKYMKKYQSKNTVSNDNGIISENIRINPQELLESNTIQYGCFHAFIIPSYKQDLQLLSQTLNKIKEHKTAKQRYLVYLAMQAHEQGSKIKAQGLIADYQNCFKQIGYTHHQMRQFQQKGKASNVSWCVEHLQELYFSKLSIRLQDIFITVIDADSWVPEVYIEQVDEHIKKHKNGDYSYIYQPCQIFTRNHLQVPFLTRTYDQSHSLVHFCNLVTAFGASFPLSNYTLSYELVKRIGFWDTCADAIGQDFHTTLKAFWKTNGKVKTIDFHTPFNQVNIQTGNGYWADVNARFWQAERHARGCADAAYCFKMLANKAVNWRKFVISYNSLQCFILPAILPWVMLGSTLQNFIYTFQTAPTYLVNDLYSNILFKICTYSFILSYLMYFIFKRKANKDLYNLPNQPLWRFIQFPLMIIPNLFLVSFPTFTIAAFKVMLNKNEYIVAQKKITKKQRNII